MPDLAVVGAGSMGADISVAAVLAGVSVTLVDHDAAALARGVAAVEGELEAERERGALSEEELCAARGRLRIGTDPDLCADAPFIIEAVPEEMVLKQEVLSDLDRRAPGDVILATSTSSLSVASLAAATGRPERVVGMHFSSPVRSRELVEVIPGPLTEPGVAREVNRLSGQLGKRSVVVADVPGFLVGRLTRPFYLEALRLLEAGTEPSEVDAVLESVGFPTGPFRLMDLQGIDVGLAISESIYERSYHSPRYRPSPVQRGMVEAGLLGRKTGRGFYEYATSGEEEEPFPESVDLDRFTVGGDPELAADLGVAPTGTTGGRGIEIASLTADAVLAGTGASIGIRRYTPDSGVLEIVGDSDRSLRREVRSLVRLAGFVPAWLPDLPGGAALRVISALANEAAFALSEGIASEEDMELALRLGAGHPRGPLQWAERIGEEKVVAVLSALHFYHGEAYLAAPLLRRRAIEARGPASDPSGTD